MKKTPAIHRAPRIVLAALLIAYPDEVSVSRLIDVLYGDDPEGGPLTADECIRAFTCQVRAAGWNVIVHGERARLVFDEMKEAKRATFSKAEHLIYHAIKDHPGLMLDQLSAKVEKKKATVAIQIVHLKKKLALQGKEQIISKKGSHDGYKIEPL